MTFTAVVVCHEGDPSRMLGNLIYQSRKPDEIIVYWSSPPEGFMRVFEDFRGRARFVICPNENDWGHGKRARGIGDATGDYIGFFNHDDQYDLAYVEKMMAKAEEGAAVVFCNWTGHQAPEEAGFQGCSSTAGNFIIRADLARQTGWDKRDYAADASFINRVLEQRPLIVKIDERLYHHE